jgi:hypothetical protein
MKLVSTFLLCLFCLVASAQNDTTKYFRSLDYGWSYKRLQAREAFIMPVDTFVNKLGMALLNNKLYSGNGIKWTLIGGSGSSTDTTSISNRINLKVDSLKKSNDSIYYFANGVRKFAYKDSAGGSNIDTTSLSNRINLKLNATDTASLSNRINLKLNATDTASLSSRINLKLNIADTTNKFVSDVTKLNDSTITIFKGSTQTNITLSPTTTVANATRLITNVYNKSGATITKGSVVYIDGAHSSNLPTIALAKANSEATSAYTYGLVETDIADNNPGVVIQNGIITNLNLPTSTYSDGQTLYLSPTVAGGYTLTKPLAPNHYVAIGTITRAHPNYGTIQVAIRNGFQLDELSDVKIALVPNDSTILQFSRVDSLWHDVDPITAMGNRFVKRTDSAAMLLPYLRKVDTTAMVLPYLRKIDTATLQNKSLSSYSFQANKTNATANATANTFKDTSGTYSGTITYVGTQPTGTINHSFRYTQIGKMCTININLSYTSANSVTSVVLTLPPIAATPVDPAGMGANGEFIYPGYGMTWSVKGIPAGTGLNSARTCWMRKNASGVYEMVIFNYSAAQTIFLSGTVIYWTN